jgi:hypothetical protein
MTRHLINNWFSFSMYACNMQPAHMQNLKKQTACSTLLQDFKWGARACYEAMWGPGKKAGLQPDVGEK